jgi:hypothetical protein
MVKKYLDKTLFILSIILFFTGCGDDKKLQPSYNENGNQVITSDWLIHSKQLYGNEIKVEVNQLKTIKEVLVKILPLNSGIKIVNAPYHYKFKKVILIDTTDQRILDHHQFFQTNGDTVLIHIQDSVLSKPFTGIGLLLRNNKGEYHFIDTIAKSEVLR